MLYDNAQMIELLSYAYISDPSITLKHQCEKNIQWMLNTLQTNQSALFSATDADTDGIEGAYYVWEQADFETLTDAEKNPLVKPFIPKILLCGKKAVLCFTEKMNGFLVFWMDCIIR